MEGGGEEKTAGIGKRGGRGGEGRETVAVRTAAK